MNIQDLETWLLRKGAATTRVRVDQWLTHSMRHSYENGLLKVLVAAIAAEHPETIPTILARLDKNA
jgi:hypothetical protein